MNKNGVKLVALTFDDGPSITTPKVLDVLEQENVVATFFLVGQYVSEKTKLIMERQLSLGCELANHSLTHRNMSVMKADEIRDEIEKTTKAIKEQVGYDVKFFRPPYIALSELMYETIDMPFIQGLGCEDWEENVSAKQRTETVLNGVQDGTIVLLHDFENNNQTVEALPALIKGLREQGYNFVTVSELFQQKGINPDVRHKIWTNVLE